MREYCDAVPPWNQASSKDMFKVTASSARQHYLRLLLPRLNWMRGPTVVSLFSCQPKQSFKCLTFKVILNLNKKAKHIIDCIITAALQPFLKQIRNTALDITRWAHTYFDPLWTRNLWVWKAWASISRSYNGPGRQESKVLWKELGYTGKSARYS